MPWDSTLFNFCCFEKKVATLSKLKGLAGFKLNAKVPGLAIKLDSSFEIDVN